MNRTLLILLAFIFVTTAHAERPGEPLDGIAAVVNDEVVLRSDLEARVEYIRRQVADGGGTLPPEDVLRRQVLERLIMERLQLQRADELGIQVSEDALNQSMNNIARRSNMTLGQFIEAVTEDGYDYAAIREDVRNEMIMNQLRQRDVLSRISVTQREIERFLASAEGGELDDREFHVSHILLRIPGSSSEDVERARARGEALLERLQGGADFAQLAMEHSEGQQALEGGDLGWRRTTHLPSVFAERVISMQPGESSDLLRTTGAFHIIRLNDVRGQSERVVIRQTRARHILIRTNEMVTDERAELRLNTILQQLDEGVEFADLARRHSEDSGSAVNGGDLGWVEPGQTVPAFEDVMDSLEPGEVSRPFATQFGWHIVKVESRRDHDSTDELRLSHARNAIRERKANEHIERWMRQMREEAWIENRLDG